MDLDEASRRYNKALVGYIGTRVKNEEEAKELAQRTWEKCIRSKQNYNPTYSFYTFLRNCANWIILDYFIKTKRSREREILLSNFPELREGIREPDITILDSGRVATHSRIPSQDSLIIFTELLCMASCCEAKPHQLITFGYHKLLQWKRSEIFQNLSAQTLRELAKNLRNMYISCFQNLVGSLLDEMNDCFETLFQRLEKTVAEVYTEHNYEALIMNHGHKKVAESKLKDYYGENPEHEITVWSNRIKQKIRDSLA
jgi:RNA polymerase sigma factor (sigma-70 family)